MSTIVIKRGTKAPTTSNLTRIGEMAIDYYNHKVYIRTASKVICINSTDTGVANSTA